MRNLIHWVIYFVLGFVLDKVLGIATWNRRQHSIVIQLNLLSNTMHYVPEDILAHIFPYAAAGSLLTAMRISHVSRDWRAAALSLSQLWIHFEYILGIEVARLQMSRISRTVAISVGITLWDIDSYSRSAVVYDTRYRRLKRWLEDTQILAHPQWKALHIDLSGDPETADRIFDLISLRKDLLDDLHIRFSQHNYSSPAAEATIMKLQFRPTRFHLEGVQFPLGLLSTHLRDLSSLAYSGGFTTREVMGVPADTSVAVLPRLSTVEFHNLHSRNFLAHARAPSLSYLHLSNALDLDPHQSLLQASAFAPSLHRLRIYASTATLGWALSADLYFPNLTFLEIELHQVERTKTFRISLRSLDFEMSFPQLQMFTLIRAFIFPDRLQNIVGLPQRALVIRLVDCTNARLIRKVPARVDLQIVFGDDVEEEAVCDSEDEEYFSEDDSISYTEEGMGGSSEESGWGMDPEVGSLRSVSTFASYRSDFRVSVWTHERRMLEMWDSSSTDDEGDEYMVEMDGDAESDLAEGRLESMALS